MPVVRALSEKQNTLHNYARGKNTLHNYAWLKILYITMHEEVKCKEFAKPT